MINEGEVHVQLNPECQGDHMHASEGEHQVQLNAGSHGGHLHADGRVKGKARAPAPHSIKSLSSTDLIAWLASMKLVLQSIFMSTRCVHRSHFQSEFLN